MIHIVKNITKMQYEKFEKYYWAASMVVAGVIAAQPAFAADAVSTLGCSATSWTVPDPLIKLKDMINGPVSWIKMLSAILMPIILLLIFLKFKSAKGRPEKIEEAQRMLVWTVGIDLLIMTISWTTSWVLGKLC